MRQLISEYNAIPYPASGDGSNSFSDSMPGDEKNSVITHIYDKAEAYEVIQCSIDDYQTRFENLGKLLLLDD